MLSITKEFHFDAAHHLVQNHLSPEENRAVYGVCALPHGHTYRLQVTVTGVCDASGMVINFCRLKELVQQHVLARYDHTDLNQLIEYQQQPPTAEHMAQHIFSVLFPVLQTDRYQLTQIRLFETASAWATVTADAPGS